MSERKRAKRSVTRDLDAGREAKRLGSAILEVLSGLRSPTEASQLLDISLQRYYKLEIRAVQGLLQALEKAPQRGPKVKPEAELARVSAERDRLQRELLRAQALVRSAQRSVGLPPLRDPKEAAKEPGKGGKGAGKRRRTPRVRARRLADELRRESAGPPAPSATPSGTTAATQRPTPPTTRPTQRSAS